MFKPPASRSASAETYLLGLKYKAPGKIDPRLLDFRYLFKEAAEPTRKVITLILLILYIVFAFFVLFVLLLLWFALK